ncbi:hypothetical protein KEM56_006040 [Ascosphaera pollenicola]|nr:hypothetical protein KEM56_006040 [Ascosphaera pollenicola]
MSAPLAFDSDADLDLAAASVAVSLAELSASESQAPAAFEANSGSAIDIFEDIDLDPDDPPNPEHTASERFFDIGQQQTGDQGQEKDAGLATKEEAKVPSKANKIRKKRFRRAKLKRLAIEDRERMLRSQNMQELQAAKAVAFYGNDAPLQVPSSSWSPSQLMPINSLHQSYMPYGIRNDDFIQASMPVTAPGMTANFAGQPGGPPPLGNFSEWGASYEFQPQQLGDRSGLNMSEHQLHDVYSIGPDMGANDMRPPSFAYMQAGLPRHVLPETLGSVAEGGPIYHDDIEGMSSFQPTEMYPSSGELDDICLMAEEFSDTMSAGLNEWYQPQIRSFDSTVDLEGNQIMSVEGVASPAEGQRLDMVMDEMSSWKYRGDPFTSLERSLAPPSHGSFDNAAQPAEFAVDPFRLVSDDSG